MWPWEHAAFGYLLYSGGVRAWWRATPGGQAVLVLLVATQLPDLVDKPLSWWLGWTPTGFSVAHSVLVAVPLVAAVAVVASRRGRPDLGLAFATGYGSHLVGDVLYPLVSGAAVDGDRVLWPVASQSPYEHDYGLVGRTLVYLADLGGTLGHGDPLVVGLFVALPAVAVLLWIADGAPGLAAVRSTVHRGDRPD